MQDIIIFFLFFFALVIGYVTGFFRGDDHGFNRRTPRLMNLLVEKHHGEYYFYDYETRKFLCRSPVYSQTLKDIMKNSNRQVFIITKDYTDESV